MKPQTYYRLRCDKKDEKVLMQRVNLQFEPSVPEFRFNTGTEKVELHRALLRLVPVCPLRSVKAVKVTLQLLSSTLVPCTR